MEWESLKNIGHAERGDGMALIGILQRPSLAVRFSVGVS
jgi:hypothetical protein